MKKLDIVWTVLVLLGVSACASPQSRSASSWDYMSSAGVAQVSNIQPLITPGFK